MSRARAGSASAGCTARGKDLKRDRIVVGAENSPGDEAAAILLWPGTAVMDNISSRKMVAAEFGCSDVRRRER